jgi:hypothetical protein
LHAGLATDATGVVEIDDAIGAAKQSDRGADFYAGSIVAVVAAQHGEMAPRIRVVTLLYVLDPGAVNAQRDIVFFFAGDRAGVAANAAILIDEKSVPHLVAF